MGIRFREITALSEKKISIDLEKLEEELKEEKLIKEPFIREVETEKDKIKVLFYFEGDKITVTYTPEDSAKELKKRKVA